MTAAAVHPPSPASERNLWLPPRRLRRYQAAKVATALLMAGIFAGWTVLQWNLPVMRGLALALLAVTGWVTFRSVVSDALRARGRQLAIESGSIVLVGPEGSTTVRVADIAAAQWRDEPSEQAGLTLLGRNGQTLARIDTVFLADQAEARSFLGWARNLTPMTFPVHWPGL